MKRLATLLCLTALACLPAFAQTNIEAIEYFFDSDPGLGNGTSIAITPGPVQDINIDISTSGLTVGFHVLGIRAKHQSGSWGITDLRTVYVASQSVASTATLDAMEYYFDTDPGPGNGTNITLPTAFPSQVDFLPTLATSLLAPGFHVLHVRARDSDGNWGIPDARPFYIVPGGVNTQADVVQFEYFFDTEPGFGAGTPLTVTAGAQVDLPALINIAALSYGFHTISIRAKDDADQWGFAETRTFYVDEFRQISVMEYFIDTDPGEGSATSIAVTPGGAVDVNVSIPTAALTGGSHTLGVRAANTDGSWGNTTTSTFNIQESQTITFGSLAAATYGDPPITLTGTTSSGLTLTYVSSDPLVATVSGSTVTIVGAGTTTITASQAGDVNYGAATDIPQVLVVNKANQSITFGTLTTKTFGDPSFTLGATSSSALGIIYSSSNTAVATISGNAVTIVGAGTTNITASQPGNGNYNAATNVVQSLLVLPASNPPSIAGSGAAFFVTDPVVINNALTVTDADGVLASATVSITTGLQSVEDQLLFTSQNGITGTYNASTGVLTLSGSASVADYQTALRSTQYDNTAASPNTADRSISFRVSDGATNSNVVTTTVVLNKPPVIEAPAKETEAGGNVVFLVDNIFSDPDDNLDLSTLTVTSAQGASITISGGIITINYSSIRDYSGTDQITFSVCDVGGKCQTEVVPVDVGSEIEIFNGISPNGDGMNDYFRIRFLPPQSRVMIFNRWGDIVYDQAEYDGTDPSKRFEGNSTSGTALTIGTYFYKIVLPDNPLNTGKSEYTGYLHINR